MSEICLEFIRFLFVAITLSDHNLNDYKCILMYIDIEQKEYIINHGMRKSGSCYLIYSSFYLWFRCLEGNERNETLCVNHLRKCQMNTFWWWRWKCVYTNIISTTSLILNDRLTRLFDAQTLIVSIGQNQRLIKRRRKNGLSTCVKDHFDSWIGTNKN